MRKGKKGTHKQLLLHVLDVDWDYETNRILRWIRTSGAKMVYIDLFCGAGGTTTGVDKARFNKQNLAIVALGINHDRVAIESHQANHPHTLHLIEDIRDVNLEPIVRLVEAIRAEFPHIKIVLWASAECTNHSIAKGGESRDADSRSLPEELFRYVQAINPDLIQIENVKEFRIWGRLRQKNLFEVYNKKTNEYDELPNKFDVTEWKHKTNHPKFGLLYSKNNTKWFNAAGFGYSTDSEKGIQEWLIPDKRFIWMGEDCKMVGEYFDAWVKGIKAFGYFYEDKDLNSADVGAITSRTRYFGQFSNGMPLMWPAQSHAKQPKKGSGLKKWKACRPALDLEDTGESMFDPNRKKPIKSKKTWSRVLQGCISHVPGGKDAYQFLLKFNSMTTKGTFQHGSHSMDGPAPTVDTQNRLAKVDVYFMQSYHAGEGRDENRTFSIDGPNHAVDTQNRYAITEVIPFIVQYNNNSESSSINGPLPPILTKDKFGLTKAHFMVDPQWTTRNGTAAKDLGKPALTIMATGQTPSLVGVEQIIPFISMYYSNGHNTTSTNEPCPTIPAADVGAIVKPEQFLYRQFSGGGTSNSLDGPAGSITGVPKMNLISTGDGKWILDTNYNNVGKSIDEPAQTLLGSRHHPYLMTHQFENDFNETSVPAPTVIASQHKKPMHLVQVEYDNTNYYAMVIYETDCEELRQLKRFMAIMGIVDIKMRMLKVPELLRIQGFPENYILRGTLTDQKKFVGNSVEVTIAGKLAECYGPYLFSESAMRAVA